MHNIRTDYLIEKFTVRNKIINLNPQHNFGLLVKVKGHYDSFRATQIQSYWEHIVLFK